MLIARLIADPRVLSASLDALRLMIAAQGGAATDAPLGGEGAIELSVSGLDRGTLRAAIDAQLTPADVLIAEAPIQFPALFVSDMDSTMISAECIDELADYAGIKPQIAAITERAMQGELDFAAALRERVALLKGLPATAIARCLAERIAPMAGARELVAGLKAAGCRTVLVTGGFHQFADPVAEMLGFDLVVANRLGIADGMLTGTLDGPICDSATKRATLLAEAGKLGEGAITCAIGDGANDIPMIEAATYGLAFMAKPRARAAADGWVDRGDLRSVLTLLA